MKGLTLQRGEVWLVNVNPGSVSESIMRRVSEAIRISLDV